MEASSDAGSIPAASTNSTTQPEYGAVERSGQNEAGLLADTLYPRQFSGLFRAGGFILKRRAVTLQ
jgi:hypothetical protein